MTLLPSTPKRDWPANAVPESWIDSLFDKMGAYYGSRFVDMWGAQKLEDVREVWGVELRKLSPEQLRAGVHSLDTAFPFPPTLPQFMAHCRQARRSVPASQLTSRGPCTLRGEHGKGCECGEASRAVRRAMGD
jgi:hypothetical protein